MNIESFIPGEHVVFAKNREKQLVIKELVEYLEKLNKIEDAGRYYAQIMHRESLDNTGIGRGLAVPHVRTDSIEDLISVFAVLKEPIDYHSFDGFPVKYVLLNIVPTGQSTRYLYLVGMISWIFTGDDRRKELDEAATKSKVYAALKKNGRLYFANLSNKSDASAAAGGNLSNVPSHNLDLLIRLDRLIQLQEGGESSERIRKKIVELRMIIDQRSLTYYERMRKRSLNPFAILERNSCSGCHMDLAPYYLAQIRESKNIAVCNHCGRFLIVI